MTEETAGTPRVDALVKPFTRGIRLTRPTENAVLDLARQLEREVAALTAERDELQRADDITMTGFSKLSIAFHQQVVRAEAAEAELDAAKRALAELNNPSEELLEKLTETYSRHLSTANRGYAQHEEGMRDTLAVLAAALAAKSPLG